MRTGNAQPANDSDHVTQAIKSQRTACCSSYHRVTTKKNAETWSRSRAWNNGSARPEACNHGCYPICILIPSRLSYSLTLTFWVGREPCFAGVARVAGPSEDEDKRDKQDFKLTEEEEELMVTFLEENECIWNKKSMDYRKPGLKTTKWEAQAKVMGKSTEHIQGWFKSMRDNYVRPRSKMPQSDGKLKTRFEGLSIVCLLLADPRAHSG